MALLNLKHRKPLELGSLGDLNEDFCQQHKSPKTLLSAPATGATKDCLQLDEEALLLQALFESEVMLHIMSSLWGIYTCCLGLSPPDQFRCYSLLHMYRKVSFSSEDFITPSIMLPSNNWRRKTCQEGKGETQQRFLWEIN